MEAWPYLKIITFFREVHFPNRGHYHSYRQWSKLPISFLKNLARRLRSMISPTASLTKKQGTSSFLLPHRCMSEPQIVDKLIPWPILHLDSNWIQILFFSRLNGLPDLKILEIAPLKDIFNKANFITRDVDSIWPSMIYIKMFDK